MEDIRGDTGECYSILQADGEGSCTAGEGFELDSCDTSGSDPWCAHELRTTDYGMCCAGSDFHCKSNTMTFVAATLAVGSISSLLI